MFKKIAILLIVTCSVWGVNINAQSPKKATLAVMPFAFSRGFQVSITGQVGNQRLNLTRQVIDTEFSNELIAFLTKSRKFTMLERQYVAKILDENNLSYSEWVKPGEEQRIGKLLLADYLVIGSINRLEFVIKAIPLKLTGRTEYRYIMTFKLQFRIVKVSSGQITFADVITKKLTSTDIRREIPASIRKDWTMGDYKDLLFNKTVVLVGNAILESIFPVKIASVEGRNVILNRGKGAGIKVGAIYNVFSQGRKVIDPDTGDVLGSSETEVGQIQVSTVLPRFSKGLVIKNTAELKPGAICRPVKKINQTTAPVYPRATPGW
jgi:Curli production assembly/transport component CsgG